MVQCIRFRFVLRSKEINSFLRIQFCRCLPRSKEKNNFSFLIHYKHQVEFFLPILFIIIQQIVTLSKYGHDALNICHP